MRPHQECDVDIVTAAWSWFLQRDTTAVSAARPGALGRRRFCNSCRCSIQGTSALALHGTSQAVGVWGSTVHGAASCLAGHGWFAAASLKHLHMHLKLHRRRARLVHQQMIVMVLPMRAGNAPAQQGILGANRQAHCAGGTHAVGGTACSVVPRMFMRTKSQWQLSVYRAVPGLTVLRWMVQRLRWLV